MLSATWSIEREWMNFTFNAPLFPVDHKCALKGEQHCTVCVPNWEKAWRHAATCPGVRALSSGAIIRKAFEMKEALRPAFDSPCVTTAFKDPNP